MRTVLFDILNEGINLGASDWHLKENDDIFMRIDSSLVPTTHHITSEIINEFISQIATKDMIEKYNKTGDLDLSFVEDNIGRLRINIHKQRCLRSISIRHIKNKILSFEELNLPPIMTTIANYNRGIIFITGTTGSGKTTTLAAMLQYINQTDCKHIITIEDPIEFDFHDELSFFEQREVGVDTISFASALKHVLRQDPDVIMVGEMRDRESFETALQAADTGHLVMTTVHATNPPQTINRIMDFYHTPEEQEHIRKALAGTLRAIISQRLVKGSQGGVIPATEIMINTLTINKLITRNQLDKISVAIENSREDGMHSFNQILVDFVEAGMVSIEDALGVAGNPEAFKMNLKGIYLSASQGILGN